MADKKISELTAATSLDGTELLPVVQSGETKKAAMTAIAVAVRNYLLDSGADLPYGPDYLFSHGEQGAWYDPSDLTTGNMYQDSAKTTAVTAVEQPVGWIQDKSGRGNHASQPTSAARPVLSARVNLLTYTEQFDNAAWTKTNCSVTSTSATDPLGGSTADVLTATGTAPATINNTTSLGVLSGTYKFSCYVKKGIGFTLWVGGNTSGIGANFNGTTGAYIATTSVSTKFTLSSYSCVSHNADYWFASITCTNSTTDSSYYAGVAINTSGGTTWRTGWGVTNGDTITLWGADLRVANDGVGLPDYQRIAAATDYDTTGFPLYLRFDGVDDCLYTSSIDFTATDRMTVWTGVRKLSDATTQIVFETSTSLNSYNGTVQLLVSSPTYGLGFGAKGTVAAGTGPTVAQLPAPVTSCISATVNIAGDSIVYRLNGSDFSSSSGDLGTGNFASQPLYIGRRGNSSLQWNGRLYSLILRGAQSTTSLIAGIETWVNGKTKAY